MIDLLRKYVQNRKVLILGFGREGQSSYRFLRAHFPELSLAIADRKAVKPADRANWPDEVPFFSGDSYLDAIADFDLVLYSPGIQISALKDRYPGKIWLSQSGLFLECYHRQIIGVTGTKGKSTTSSLICHILKKAGKKVVLIGNIGVPPLDLWRDIDKDTLLVFELSANQLQYVRHSPHIAVLLNLFPEHLDFFGSESSYYMAKWNIARFQSNKDIFIYDPENEAIQRDIEKFNLTTQKFPIDTALIASEADREGFASLIQSTEVPLKGRHNIKNMLAAWIACRQVNIGGNKIILGIKSFKSLEHRLEFVGNFCGIDFYNDSISTIPESTLAALQTLAHVHTLILGGHDRGISYSRMLQFIAGSKVQRILFTGAAGKRMMQEFAPMKQPVQEVFFEERFIDLARCLGSTPQGMACLLSPAASSYDQFQDFEARGRAFKKMAENLAVSCHEK